MQRRITSRTLALAVAVLVVCGAANAQYRLKNLSSNQVKQAAHTDPLLVNAWGMVHAPGSPWWISDNNSGWSTLYDASGNTIQQLKVLIPTAGENGPGSPTGIVFNGTAGPAGSHEFQVQGWASVFLFAAMDGTISGWAPQSNFNQSIIAVDNSKTGSMYTGLAITSRKNGNLLFATDMANNKVDVFDATFKLVNSFTDTTLPAGFAPFGIQDINGIVYVTFASTTGGAGGFVDQFTEDGKLMNGKSLIQGAPLNQPWGIAVAPASFGPLSNTLLVSNNTDTGTINAFNATSGAFVGMVNNDDGSPIRIDQLWAIGFGDGLGRNGAANQLFFTAGPSGNLAGTFGVIVFEPEE